MDFIKQSLFPSKARQIRLSLVINCYFDNESDALNDLLGLYASYSSVLLDRLQFVIVDDGSPMKAEPDMREVGVNSLNMTMVRIKENIPWNQGGARNLGVVYALSEKILMTDVDHQFTESALEALLRQDVPRKVIYKMARYRKGRLIRYHPNTFLLRRSRFLELYGYDEEFSGNYGCDDEMFAYWQSMMGTRFRWLPKTCAVELRDFNVETETHSLVRDRSHNLALLADRRAALHGFGPDACHSRRFLAFSWETVIRSQREQVAEWRSRGYLWHLRLRVLERLRRWRSRSPYQVSCLWNPISWFIEITANRKACS
jgi:hypothetical protein